MRANDYEHIILSDHEDIKQEFYIKSAKGKKASRELLLLTDKRIYFYGKEKKLFMRSNVSRFLNLKAIFAGSRSKGRYTILLLVSILLLFLSVVTYGLSSIGSASTDQTVSILGFIFGALFLVAYLFLTEKIITLEYPGDNLVIHCNRMKEKEINRMFRLISNAIDHS